MDLFIQLSQADRLFFNFKSDGKMETERHEITSENKEEELKRWHFTESAFGPNPQPVLERVEFKVRFTQQSVLDIHA